MKIKEHFKEVAIGMQYSRKQEALDGSQQAQSSDAASIQHVKDIALHQKVYVMACNYICNIFFVTLMTDFLQMFVYLTKQKLAFMSLETF